MMSKELILNKFILDFHCVVHNRNKTVNKWKRKMEKTLRKVNIAQDDSTSSLLWLDHYSKFWWNNPAIKTLNTTELLQHHHYG